MGLRRISREFCLQFLYLAEAYNIPAQSLLDETDVSLWSFPAETREFALTLISGTAQNIKEIDAVIAEQAQNWDINRMSLVDKNLLRMAVYELLTLKSAPPAVIINETIELAKSFSTDNSGRFINGLLDKIKDKKLNGNDA